MYRKARAKALLRQAQNELASGVVDKDEVKSEESAKGSKSKKKRKAKKTSKAKKTKAD